MKPKVTPKIEKRRKRRVATKTECLIFAGGGGSETVPLGVGGSVGRNRGKVGLCARKRGLLFSVKKKAKAKGSEYER